MLRRVLGLALAACAAAGCASTVVARSYPPLAERRERIERIAVVPLEVKTEAAAGSAPLVASQLAEAIRKRGVKVVSPEDVGLALGADPAAGVAALAALAKNQFGADAVVLGEITRWIDREGGAAGTQQPAAVGLHVSLYTAPDGERLWEGSFDHTQQSMLSNVLLTPRYPGGGTRWLTAEEFADFAASELAAALPLPE